MQIPKTTFKPNQNDKTAKSVSNLSEILKSAPKPGIVSERQKLNRFRQNETKIHKKVCIKQIMREIKTMNQLEQEQEGLYPYQIEYL